jgi:hypothetical protein
VSNDDEEEEDDDVTERDEDGFCEKSNGDVGDENEVRVDDEEDEEEEEERDEALLVSRKSGIVELLLSDERKEENLISTEEEEEEDGDEWILIELSSFTIVLFSSNIFSLLSPDSEEINLKDSIIPTEEGFSTGIFGDLF